MGVTGLWRLIEPAGKPVPVETLENKVLAVDISIWLHQMVKGYQDAKGAPIPNAHLMGLFQRLCKLLYFRIKPVFVFDGGFPDLKKETIAKRQDSKAKYNSESERIKRELALLLSKKSAISNLLGKAISPKKGNNSTANNDDLFKLPALPENKQESESESEDESSSSSIVDLHSVDIESKSFKNMPVKEKYDLLIELKETRKMNSWGKLNELPKKSDNFSDFQMQRLLKRRKVQECLEETEKEMGDGGMSINELESILNEDGIDTKIEDLPTRRIASNDNTRYLLINNVKQALHDAKKRKELQNNPGTSASDASEETANKEEKQPIKDELEEDLEKAIKMSLECVDNHDTSNYTSKTDDSWTSVLSDTDYSDNNTDSEEGDGYEQPNMSTAKAYIQQYSDFTNTAINKIISSKHPAHKNKPSISKIDKILEDINKEKSVIVDKLDISSDEDSSEPHERVIEDKIQFVEGNDAQICDDDINATQASVLYVENPAPPVVTLDTSGEDISDNHTSFDKTDPGLDASQKNILKLDSNDIHTVNAIPVKIEEVSIEDEFVNDSDLNKQNVKTNDSSSSDDEFEDVPEIENKVAKPVVQLTLDMDQVCDEDDIFADVFADKKQDENCKGETNNLNKITNSQDIAASTDKYKIKKLEDATDVSNKTPEIPASIRTIVNIDNNNTSNVPREDKINSHNYEDDLEKAIKMSLECVDQESVNQASKTEVNNIESTILSPKIHSNAGGKKEFQFQLKSTSQNEPIAKQVISTEKLNEMAEAVVNEEKNLVQEKGRLDRVGRNITEQMTKEAQELLQLFGIPYIVAPMEAEAQCAFLETVKLTDGTITDDSDIWLFGGKTVYKNFFNQKKHVLQFLSEKIEKSFIGLAGQTVRPAVWGTEYYSSISTGSGEDGCTRLGAHALRASSRLRWSVLSCVGRLLWPTPLVFCVWLSQFVPIWALEMIPKRCIMYHYEKLFYLAREQLILLALLVGSDYTTGIDGVGPVTAMEILASFPFNKKQLLSETSKQHQYQHIVTGMQEFKKWVRAGKRTDNTNLKKKLRNVKLSDDFPSVRVVQAYLEPNVEKNEDKFTWGEIDITILRDYTKTKFGWSQNKLDEIIKPVLKRLQERKSQKTMQDYFRKKLDIQSLENQMSKRVKAAVQKLGPEQLIDDIASNLCEEMDIEKTTKPARKRKKNIAPKSKSDPNVAGPSRKVRITTGGEIDGVNVTAMAHVEETASGIDIIIPKTDRYQEVIPQREKDKHCLLQNKMKAIELFRKTKIDRKKKVTKRKVLLPKDKAELSESSDAD